MLRENRRPARKRNSANDTTQKKAAEWENPYGASGNPY